MPKNLELLISMTGLTASVSMARCGAGLGLALCPWFNTSRPRNNAPTPPHGSNHVPLAPGVIVTSSKQVSLATINLEKKSRRKKAKKWRNNFWSTKRLDNSLGPAWGVSEQSWMYLKLHIFFHVLVES